MSDWFANSRLKGLYCHFSRIQALISPGICQADTPHLLGFALRRDNQKDKVTCEDNKEPCEIEQYFGRLEDQFVSKDFSPAPRITTHIDFVTLCPKPYFFNSGPHRALMGLWYKGERYLLAVEEASKPSTENLFISAYASSGMMKLADKRYAIEILSAGVLAVTGEPLYMPVHKFKVNVIKDAFGLMTQACEPSPDVFNF